MVEEVQDTSEKVERDSKKSGKTEIDNNKVEKTVIKPRKQITC